MFNPVQEPREITLSRQRAQAEGLSVVAGHLHYRNPEGFNGPGEIVRFGNLEHLDGKLQDVGLTERTHIVVKTGGEWIGAATALGQILTYFKMPIKRYSEI